MTTARSTASVRSGEQPWHPADAEGGEEPAPTYPQTEPHASGSMAWPFDGLTAEDGDAGGPMGSSCTKSIDPAFHYRLGMGHPGKSARKK